MFVATKDKILPTTVIGSYPRAHWYTESLIISSDCGFGREGLSRRIAFYKCVSIVMGTNIVRKELGLPEVDISAANENLYF